MKRSYAILAAAALAIAACEEKKTDAIPTEDPASKNATTTGGTAAPVAITVEDGDLATPADFEETAENAITKANDKTELSSIEAAIAKE